MEGERELPWWRETKILGKNESDLQRKAPSQFVGKGVQIFLGEISLQGQAHWLCAKCIVK